MPFVKTNFFKKGRKLLLKQGTLHFSLRLLHSPLFHASSEIVERIQWQFILQILMFFPPLYVILKKKNYNNSVLYPHYLLSTQLFRVWGYKIGVVCTLCLTPPHFTVLWITRLIFACHINFPICHLDLFTGP